MKISKESLRNYLTTRRSFMLLGGKLSLLGLLSLRMLYIQIFEGTKYKTLADQNRVNVLMLNPERGVIKDKEGKIIAENHSIFKLILDKLENASYQDSLAQLAEILNFSEEERSEIEKRAKKVHPRFPSSIIDNLTWKQISIIEENIELIPGLYVEMGLGRTYPLKDLLAHPIGYMAKISEQDKAQLGIGKALNIEVGKGGIEKFYEEKLRGQFGMKEAEVNAKGNLIREISHTPSVKGDELKLNIDLQMQKLAMKLLPKRGGSIIAMNPQDGKVITLASSPSFDPNEFTNGLSHKYWKSILENPSKPLINKAVQTQYPPGSIFKMIIAIAAMEAGMDPDLRVNCTGKPFLGNDGHFRCWKKVGHGNLDLKSAIKHSCNTYMYHIAQTIGIEKIAEVAEKLGFGNPTGIDLTGEAPGLVPNMAWKRKKFRQKWHLGDSLNTAIGQGFALSTPIQIARFCSILASGKLVVPRLMGEMEAMEADIDPKHLDLIRDAMFEVTNKPGGTGYIYRIRDPKWQIAGKTGTCQVISKVRDENLSAISTPWLNRNHAMFIGYGPVPNPKFALSVIVDHGGGGASMSAPIARDMMLALFKKYC